MNIQNPHIIIMSLGFAIGIALFLGYIGKAISYDMKCYRWKKAWQEYEEKKNRARTRRESLW